MSKERDKGRLHLEVVGKGGLTIGKENWREKTQRKQERERRK